MHEYDVTLKGALRRLAGSVLRPLSGLDVSLWHNVELPVVRSRRVDMLGETADGTLLHIELQSTNQAGMAQRMLDYASAINWRFGSFPRQLVLYVGAARLRMNGDLKTHSLTFHCRIVDIRELDGERLLASRRVEDNVIAVLAHLSDERAAIQRILRKIAACAPRRREAMFTELMLLAGLRKLGWVILQEAKQVPILADIMDHDVLGPERRRGIKLGREQGLQEGERLLLLRMIARRFGPVKPALRKRIEAVPASKIEAIAVRLFEAASIDELLR